MTNQLKNGYLVVAILTLIAGALTLIAIGVILFFPSGGKAISVQAEEIITRTSVIAKTEDANDVWAREIASGQLNLSDYVRISLTGSNYLLQDRDDNVFAQDLAYVAYGTVGKKDEILKMLQGRSRKFVIEKILSGIDPRYAPLQGFSDEKGTQLITFRAENPLTDRLDYIFGLRKISGTIEIEGDEARTDFFVDETLRPGHLSLVKTPSGVQVFSMTWDVRREESGLHDVKVLLRTSDGRGKVITGGKVIVPSFIPLENDDIVQGLIPERESISWYSLNAGDRDAYINFVNTTDDIRVTLYTVFGEEIGSNDLHGFPHEILRGKKQPKILTEITSIDNQDENNVFYAKVERSPDAPVSVIEIHYTIVAAKNVAVHKDGQLLAILDDIDAVPTTTPYHPVSEDDAEDPILCANEKGEQTAYAREDLDFLPLNGLLTSMFVRTAEGSRTFRIYPDFNLSTRDYAYVFEDDSPEISLDCITSEGYAARVVASNLNFGSQVFNSMQEGPIPLVDGENVISVRVIGFDGEETEYRIFLLNKEDSTDFGEEVLLTFPSGYRSGLWLLHNLFPQYRFVPYITGIDWTDLVDNEDYKGTSLANANSNPQWVKPESIVYDGSGWKAAKRNVVEYFLDPRNFLTPVHIFQFEKLSFDASVHTRDGVADMVKNSFLDSDKPDYPEILYAAGQDAGISPYFLASRIIQEMGRKGQSKLASGTLEGYEGYYNLFNIGSTPNPDIQDGAIINGARYAQWGRDPDERQLTEEELEILLPWTSPELSIRGGALWIASSYVDIGQNTLYFQKFDVIENEDGLFRHQYAQNISMAFSESSRYFNAYLSQDMLDSPFLFIIPIYENMPSHYTGVL